MDDFSGFMLLELQFPVQCFADRCLPFSLSIDHSIVCPSINSFFFWLPICYLHTFLSCKYTQLKLSIRMNKHLTKITLYKNQERTLNLPNISYFQQLLSMPASTYAMQFCQWSINCLLHDVELQHHRQIFQHKFCIANPVWLSDILLAMTYFLVRHSSIHYIKESIFIPTNYVSLFDQIMQIRH